MSNTVQIQNNYSQVNYSSQIRAEGDDIIFFIDLDERRRKMVNAVLSIFEEFKFKLNQMEILTVTNSINSINLIDMFLDKFNNLIEKKIVVITTYGQLARHYSEYKYKKILETWIEDIKMKKENENMENMEKLKSTAYYNGEKDIAILVHSYLPSFTKEEKIADTIVSYLTYESNLAKEEYNYYLGERTYTILYKSNSEKKYNVLYHALKSHNDRYYYFDLRNDWYDELEDREFKIVETKNIIVTEVTPLALLSFVRTS